MKYLFILYINVRLSQLINLQTLLTVKSPWTLDINEYLTLHGPFFNDSMEADIFLFLEVFKFGVKPMIAESDETEAVRPLSSTFTF